MRTNTDQYRFSSLLHETARSWRQQLNRRFERLGLSQSQWLVLLKLPPEGSTQKVLAEAAGIEGPTLVGLLDRLELNGWITRSICLNDRRAKLVLPTPKALQMQATVQQVATGMRQEILSGIDENRVQECAAVLAEIKQRIEALDD